MSLKTYFIVLAKTSWLWGIPILGAIILAFVEIIQERRKGNVKKRSQKAN